MGESILRRRTCERKKGERSRAKVVEKANCGAGVVQPRANPQRSCGPAVIVWRFISSWPHIQDAVQHQRGKILRKNTALPLRETDRLNSPECSAVNNPCTWSDEHRISVHCSPSSHFVSIVLASASSLSVHSHGVNTPSRQLQVTNLTYVNLKWRRKFISCSFLTDVGAGSGLALFWSLESPH